MEILIFLSSVDRCLLCPSDSFPFLRPRLYLLSFSISASHGPFLLPSFPSSLPSLLPPLPPLPPPSPPIPPPPPLMHQVFLVRKIVGPDAGRMYAMKVLKKATLKGENLSPRPEHSY